MGQILSRLVRLRDRSSVVTPSSIISTAEEQKVELSGSPTLNCETLLWIREVGLLLFRAAL